MRSPDHAEAIVELQRIVCLQSPRVAVHITEAHIARSREVDAREGIVRSSVYASEAELRRPILIDAVGFDRRLKAGEAEVDVVQHARSKDIVVRDARPVIEAAAGASSRCRAGYDLRFPSIRTCPDSNNR